MLFDRPPRGHHDSPAIATQRPGAAWTILVVAAGVTADAGVLGLSLVAPLPTPVVGGLSGLVAALMVMGAGRRWYAVGAGWIRRGHEFVSLAKLTAIHHDGRTVLLLDARQDGGWWARLVKPGRLRIPVQQFRADSELGAALRDAVRHAASGEDALVTPSAATEFDLASRTP